MTSSAINLNGVSLNLIKG